MGARDSHVGCCCGQPHQPPCLCAARKFKPGRPSAHGLGISDRSAPALFLYCVKFNISAGIAGPSQWKSQLVRQHQPGCALPAGSPPTFPAQRFEIPAQSPARSPVISSQDASMSPPEPLPSSEKVQLAGSAAPEPMSAMVKGGGETAAAQAIPTKSARATPAAAGILGMVDGESRSPRQLCGQMRSLVKRGRGWRGEIKCGAWRVCSPCGLREAHQLTNGRRNRGK